VDQKHEIKCPGCGNTDLSSIRAVGTIPITYQNLSVVDGSLCIDTYNNELEWEAESPTKLVCVRDLENPFTQCLTEFDVPDELSINWE
jgi:hypothetical protein